MDGFGFAEFDNAATEPDLLALAADQMHFDAPALFVVKCLMTKCVEIEIRAEFAVEARQEIQVELRRHAGRIIVGGVENVGVLGKIDANDQNRSRA